MIRICLAALMFVASGPSWAGWQKTQWGMTLDEVIAAGEGKIMRYSDGSTNATINVELGLQAFHQLAAAQQFKAFDIDFKAYFLFRESKLSFVNVRVDNTRNIRYLMTLLRETYGNPVELKFEEQGGCKQTSASWRDQSLSNNVTYYEYLCGSDRVKSTASITYRPLREPGKSGL